MSFLSTINNILMSIFFEEERKVKFGSVVPYVASTYLTISKCLRFLQGQIPLISSFCDQHFPLEWLLTPFGFCSLRCQPEHIDHLKNGVFVLKGEGNFDSTNKPERLGKVSLSYVHCIDHNWYWIVFHWSVSKLCISSVFKIYCFIFNICLFFLFEILFRFVGTEVRTDIESRRRGPTLRDQELRTFLGMKSPEVKIGTWYRWTDPDVVFRLRVKAQNGFNNLNVKGRIEKTFPEHSLTPFFHFTFNPFSTDTFEFGVGVNLGSCY